MDVYSQHKLESVTNNNYRIKRLQLIAEPTTQTDRPDRLEGMGWGWVDYFRGWTDDTKPLAITKWTSVFLGLAEHRGD